MNLFVLHASGSVAARMLCDQHINKMILETAQILDGGTRPLLANLDPGAKRKIVGIPPSHRDNKIIHSASSTLVWDWAWQHFRGLLDEFYQRYSHAHSYTKLIKPLTERHDRVRGLMNARGFRLAMPDEFKLSDEPYVSLDIAIGSYRAYYALTKTRYGEDGKPCTWRRTPPPRWLDTARRKAGDIRQRTEDGRYYFYEPEAVA